MKHFILSGLIVWLFSCAPAPTPSATDIARKVRAGGLACIAEVDSAIRNADWIDEFYQSRRAEIDAFVARAITDTNGYGEYEYYSAVGTLKFSHMEKTHLLILSRGHSYELDLGYDFESPARVVNLDDKYIVSSYSSSVRYAADSEPSIVDGGIQCETPTQSFERARQFAQSSTPKTDSFTYRNHDREWALFAYGASEDEDSEYGGPTIHTVTACDGQNCVGLSRFSETGYERDEITTDMGVPKFYPAFVKQVFE